MTNERKQQLLAFYRDRLFNDVIPFWEEHAVDREYGGFMDYLDREGRPLSTDKGGWVQGRAVWIFAELTRMKTATPEQIRRWSEVAENGVRFIREKLRRADGRVWFEVTREGEPLVMRRYVFTEMFACMGLAAWASVSGDPAILREARELFRLLDTLPPRLPSKIETATRPLRGHSATMMMINVCQVLREHDPQHAADYSRRIELQCEELFRYFVKPEYGALFETVAENGNLAEGPEGRCVNPGHTIETAWFLLEEAVYKKDAELQARALRLLDWMLAKGWDDEYGGLFSFIDIDGRQPAQVEWDMKYWWPHCEAMYATLLAHHLTGAEKYARWFERLHTYSWDHFPDTEHGEWFGYLRRDGSVKMTLKGNHYKGPFHIPRFLILAIRLLED